MIQLFTEMACNFMKFQNETSESVTTDIKSV